MRLVAGLLLLLAACSSEKFSYAEKDASTGGDAAVGGSSGTGGSVSTGGAFPGSEDCTNGLDDDGDGKADCADVADCECLPQVLSGWDGPYVLTPAAVDVAEPPECPTSAPTEVDIVGRMDAPAAICPTCSCGSPTGGCTQATIVAYGAASCSGSTFLTWNKKTSDACMQTGTSGGGPQSLGASVDPAGASCPVLTTGQQSIPSVRFVERRRLCSGPLGVCAAGHCAAPASGGERWCVLGTTAQTCPSAYSVQEDLDTETVLTDTRKCSGCSCAISNPTCAGWKVTFGSACSALGGNLTPTTSCVPWTNSNVAAAVQSTGKVSATCTPAGGKPNGKVTTDAVRLCCTS